MYQEVKMNNTIQLRNSNIDMPPSPSRPDSSSAGTRLDLGSKAIVGALSRLFRSTCRRGPSSDRERPWSWGTDRGRERSGNRRHSSWGLG